MSDLKFTIVKDDEFAVLCALYGITHFFGSLDMGEVKLSKQEIYGLLYKLYKKELLTYDDDKMTLAGEMKMVFEGLKEATRLLTFVNPNTSENHSFYYIPGKVHCINLQKGWEDPHSIRLRCVSKAEVIKICEEAELLPKQSFEEGSVYPIELSRDELMMKEYLEVNMYDLATSDKLAQVHIGMEALNTVSRYIDETKDCKEIYVLHHLKSLITTLLQEETHYDNG